VKKMVFVVEDDAALREAYEYMLEGEFDCRCFEGGEGLFLGLEEERAALVLLDIMLPGDDGFAILERLKSRKTTRGIPVILVSAKGDEISKVKGLNMGADDYITKPFGVLEVIARIKANLRKFENGEKLAYKNILVDEEKYQISVDGKAIQTTLKEFNLLKMLCENSEKVQGREEIFAAVWGEDFMGETRTLDIHIKKLRRKLGDAGSNAEIKTVRGVGYMLL